MMIPYTILVEAKRPWLKRDARAEFRVPQEMFVDRTACDAVPGAVVLSLSHSGVGLLRSPIHCELLGTLQAPIYLAVPLLFSAGEILQVAFRFPSIWSTRRRAAIAFIGKLQES